MPTFEDSDFGVDTPLSPVKSRELHRVTSRTQTQHPVGSHTSTISIPSDNSANSVEIPATRSSISDASQGSRDSFGASLPIPKSKRQSRLSSVYQPDGKALRPEMPLIQPTRDILAAQMPDLSTERVRAAKDMAFVFDIDDVLVHGNRLIPEDPAHPPHNESGKPEVARVEQLSKILKSPISTDQFVQSHTPMRALSEYYKTVLVVGGEGYKCREVAEQYGFEDIVVPNNIIAWDPTIAPYRVFTEEERATSRPRDFSKMNIDAIMVFSDSRDYHRHNGRLGTVAKDPVSHRIPIYFSQGDMLCPTEHPIPRMSQGTFRIGLEAMYKALSGVDLGRTVYGKPEPATYKYADGVMASWMEQIHNDERLPSNIYMVGDNPASDIVGGNMYGWNTCLVRSGVYQGEGNDKENPASFGVFKNVLEVVKTAIKKELGEEFRFEFDERINPVLHGNGASATE